MKALFDRPHNKVQIHPIDTGDSLKVWKDPDSADLYFVESASGQVFGMDADEVKAVFGRLPD